MLFIPMLKSTRFAVQLKEIAMLNAIKLANMPPNTSEQQDTFLLNSIIESVEGLEENPLFWTVQERLFVIGHYIVATQDDNPDFVIGNANYSDYLQAEKHYTLDHLDLGVYEEDMWTAVPLLGVMAETIESLEGAIDGVEGRMHWSLGCMACQLIPNGKELDYYSPDYYQKVLERMLTLSQIPESAFIHLLTQLTIANTEFTHLFKIALTDKGIAVVPKVGGTDKPYARFPAHSAITTLSQQLCGKPQLSSP